MSAPPWIFYARFSNELCKTIDHVPVVLASAFSRLSYTCILTAIASSAKPGLMPACKGSFAPVIKRISRLSRCAQIQQERDERLGGRRRLGSGRQELGQWLIANLRHSDAVSYRCCWQTATSHTGRWLDQNNPILGVRRKMNRRARKLYFGTQQTHLLLADVDWVTAGIVRENVRKTAKNVKSRFERNVKNVKT